MKFVFVDTHYWIARANPKDQWHQAAKNADQELGDCIRITTDGVLTEFLGALGGKGGSGGPHLRNVAIKMVRAIMGNPNVQVVPETRKLFLKGLDFYEKRNDKEYSLVDCISMIVMQEKGLNEVLTNDHHFAQEGFSVLIKQ